MSLDEAIAEVHRELPRTGDRNEVVDRLFERFEARKAAKPDPKPKVKLDIQVGRLQDILPGHQNKQLRSALREVARTGNEETFSMLCLSADLDKVTIARVARALLKQRREKTL